MIEAIFTYIIDMSFKIYFFIKDYAKVLVWLVVFIYSENGK